MSLHTEQLPAFHHPECAPELVLLHGWGRSSSVWQSWLPLLRRHCNVLLVDLPGFGGSEAINVMNEQQTLQAILAAAPERAIYLGYSLGGMLALKLASDNPERVQALITLSANLSFLQKDDWQQAMPEATYQAFYELVKEKPALGKKRFSALQLMGATELSRLKKLPVAMPDASDACLTPSLDLLAAIDNTNAIAKLQSPTLFLYGSNDQLVPASVVDEIPSTENRLVEVIEGAPHCIFVSHEEESWRAIDNFLHRFGLLSDTNMLRDKMDVARSFSRAAATYDSVAELQRRVGEKLLTLLPSLDDSPDKEEAQRVLDLGAGTGFFAGVLQHRFPEAEHIGLDLAEGMVRHASQSHSTLHWLCGDAEALPLASGSIDVMFSSLAVQWCEDSAAMFAEIYRVLRPGGSFVFATLGPESLHELRKAWQQVDNLVHVNQFAAQSSLTDAAVAAGFNGGEFSQLQQQSITLEYDELKHLTRELKALGAHNVNSGRPAGLTGKKCIQAFAVAYDQQRNKQGKLPLSYKVWYVRLTKPTEEPAQATVACA